MAAEPIVPKVHAAVLDGVRASAYFRKFGFVPNVGVEVTVVSSEVPAVVQVHGLAVGYLPADFDPTVVGNMAGLVIAAQSGSNPSVTVKLIIREV